MSIEDINGRKSEDEQTFEQTFEDFMSPELTRIHKAVMKCMARKLYQFNEETK
jgi:hypothetical protein